MRMDRVCRSLVALALLTAYALAAAPRALAEDFYHGKTLTIIVGFATGGGVDTGARTIARHLVRFLPGQPAVVIRNMEGAAGVIAANHLASRAESDGLTLAVPGRGWFLEAIMKTPNVIFEPNKLSYIGSGGPTNTAMWVRPDTGIATFDDLKAGRGKLVFGSLGPGTNTGLVPAMLAGHGLPVRVVFGYGSTARILLAIEQNEVNAIFTPDDTFALRQHLIENKVVIPLVQTRPILTGIPLLRDVLPPSDRPMLELVVAAESFGLMLVGPSGIPPDRLEILRRAFLAMAADKEYQADAAKIALSTGTVLDGTTLAAMMQDLTNVATPEVIAAFKRLRGDK